MNKLKVTVIGGGSSYTPEIIEGITNKETFPVTELCLMDIPAGEEKMRIIGALAKRMFRKSGKEVNLTVTTDRKKALEDADFVLSQFRVGGLDARIKDERIPLKYGLIGQETTGAGGFAKALRTIPVTLDICKDMEQICPNAWLVNFTNPSGIITEAVTKHSSISAVGLCNLPIGLRNLCARTLGVDPDRIYIDYVGLNHLLWGREIYLDGEIVTSSVIDILASKTGSEMKNIKGIPWNPTFLRSLEMVPCDYHRYYYMTNEMFAAERKQAEEIGTRGEIIKGIEKELFAIYADEEVDIKPPQLSQRGGAYYSVAAVNLIDSIYNDRKDIQTVDVVHHGALAGLSHDAVIETNAIIGRRKIQPLVTGKAPEKISGLIQLVKSYEQQTIEAAVSGDYHIALQALITNPLINSINAAEQVLDELLLAHKEYLPNFKDVIGKKEKSYM